MPEDTAEPLPIATDAVAGGNADEGEKKPAPKKRARRTVKKADPEAEGESAPAAEAPAAEAVAEVKPKRRPGRPRKVKVAEEAPVAAPQTPAAPASGEPAAASGNDAQAAEAKPKRRPGRPRKVKAAESDAAAAASEPEQLPLPVAAAEKAAEDAASSVEPEPADKPKRRRTRKAKAAEGEAPAEAAPSSDAAPAADAQPATEAASASLEPEAASGGSSAEEETPRRNRRNRHKDKAERSSDDAAANDSQQGGKQGKNNHNNGNGNNNRNDRRNNRNERNRRNRGFVAEPSLSREDVAELKVAELRAKAAELGIDYVGMRKAELADAVYAAAARAEGFRSVDGILEIGNEGYGWLRTGNYMEGDDDCFVHQQIIRNLGLRPGDRVAGTVGPGRNNSKYPPLQQVATVNGRAPEGLKDRPRFRDLTPVFPNERLVMEHGKDSITGRAIDLVSPIGKGQRGLIVSPPKAGKTTVLKKICQSIAVNNPEVHLFCLLVDERPEEVTDMQRSIKGEVVASTFDMPADNHTHVSELVIEHAKRLVEMGEDVVVVLDSITRLARAYNLAQPASGRILSGGVDSAALYPPKKFLGAARNIENGGSLTIIASALVDTGSKMDEVIFEEFKGTGNMELKLDRELADKRIFPAIDPVSSGTRNEDLLIAPDYQPFVWGIRRVLANMNNVERAANALVKGLKGTNDNREFLIKSAKKAQQSDYIA